jgi:putative oxidoreductase
VAVGTTLLRLAVGAVFVGHGLQKLKGYWGGPGLDGTEQMMTRMEMHPAPLQARAVAIAETAGGVALAAGIATPLAGAALIATMVTAVRKVHLKNGPWNSKGGYEFNAVLTAAVLAVVADGPGPVSGDGIVGRSRGGAGAALFALGAGIAGSFLATTVARVARPTEAGAEGDADAGGAADTP